MTEYEKMGKGEWIVTNDPEIVRRNREATRLWREFSQTGTDDEPTWRKVDCCGGLGRRGRRARGCDGGGKPRENQEEFKV